jgi:tRNA threonylcarbamoyladenosine biosynthesis protein TsaE
LLATAAIDEAAMASLAAKLASLVEPPLVVYLEGDLGAGKTSFTRAFIRALGHQGSVKSPTYGLLEDYPLGHLHVVHLDLYRIEQPGELEFLGLEDLCDDRSVFMVEWPGRGEGHLPQADLVIRFRHVDDSRILEFEAVHSAAIPLLQRLAAHTPSFF